MLPVLDAGGYGMLLGMGWPPRSWMHPQIPGSPKSQMPNQDPHSLQGSQMLLGAQ